MQVLQQGQNMWSDEDCAHWTARVAEIYGMDATISGLDGEFDLNAAVMVNGQFTGVLKIMRADCDVSFVDMQIAALAHLAAGAADLPVPQVINRSDGAALGHIPDKDGAMRLVWMLSALLGRQLGNHRPHTPALMTQIGTALGGLTTALAGFDHPQLDREFKWHPRTPHWAFDALDAIEDLSLIHI